MQMLIVTGRRPRRGTATRESMAANDDRDDIVKMVDERHRRRGMRNQPRGRRRPRTEAEPARR